MGMTGEDLDVASLVLDSMIDYCERELSAGGAHFVQNVNDNIGGTVTFRWTMTDEWTEGGT